MLKNGVSLFNSPSKSDAVKTTQESLKVAIREDGVPVLLFAPFKAAGYGPQAVPVAELPAFLSALNGYAEGVERAENAERTATDMLHATIATVEGDDSTVTFKLSGERGSKSTRIAIRDIRGVVNVIRGSLARINEIAGIVTPGDETNDEV